MTEEFTDAYLDALNGMRRRGPRELHAAAAVFVDDATVPLGDEALRDHLRNASGDNPLRRALHGALAIWDNTPIDAVWAANTAPNSRERRDLINQLLKVDDGMVLLFEELFPVAAINGPTVIADGWNPWYTAKRRYEREFYWTHYQSYLEQHRGWTPEAIISLDIATDRVVERLTDPLRAEAYQAKGLVVGHVQSGKTANFTGVIAKAIDAGYRLIIVLTGTTDMLREQTQRRLDMELVGRENILRGVGDDARALDGVDYQNDDDWLAGHFVSHGDLPSKTGYPNVRRLTTHRWDYQSLRQGIEALDFVERSDQAKPFHDTVNLFAAAARLIVVKKNGPVLDRLVKDLSRITTVRGEIPTLIIDDESDQASINTMNPARWRADQENRTRINHTITRLLGMLPRAQYLGYTATPFANVFIDPADGEDIFPKDFLISLDRPVGYMGALDFHDIDYVPLGEERTLVNSNELAHIREIPDDLDDSDDSHLLEAMDAFVLAGAVKLYRAQVAGATFRHHTMLVHEARTRDVHREQAARLRDLWLKAGYFSALGQARLRDLYARETLPVMRARAGQTPTPAGFEELAPYVAQAVAKIGDGGDPVLIINSDADVQRQQEALDFDRRDVWRILVGGNKLARGFTVEGLTVSYYRRMTKQADTLMQMGRWFGFRRGYQDLVRLYITAELREAFEANCRDEEDFRGELRRYATLVDGRPQVTPKQVKPLVYQRLPWLKPTATNKRYNAELVERRSPGKPFEPHVYPAVPDQRRYNVDVFADILNAATERTELASRGPRPDILFTGEVSHSTLVTALTRLRWSDPENVAPDLHWLTSLTDDEINRWMVLLPQQRGAGNARTLAGRGPLTFSTRTEIKSGYVGSIAEPHHREWAKYIAGAGPERDHPALAQFASRPKTGAIVLYPTVTTDVVPGHQQGEIDAKNVIIMLCAVAPTSTLNAKEPLVTFRTRDNPR